MADILGKPKLKEESADKHNVENTKQIEYGVSLNIHNKSIITRRIT